MTNDQYEREKKFIVFYVSQIMKVEPGSKSDPVDVLESFEKESMSKAKKGLSMAINDTLEMTESWPSDAVREFDRILEENGAATLTELRMRHSKKYRKVLKRGAINSEVEYYLVKGIVDGMQEHIPKDELPLLDAMLIDYENKLVGSGRTGSG